MSARRRPVRGNRDAGAVSAAAARDDDDDDDDSGDVVKVHYRFSILAVRRFVDQLSDEQQEVVRSMGFGGVLHLTAYSKLDRHFSAWLCNQLELATTAAAAAPGGAAASSSAPAPLFLKDGAGETVPVVARDVHEVLGIPNGERRVGLARTSSEKESDAAAVRRALGLDPGEAAATLQLAEAVVARRRKGAPSPSPGPMTQPERDAFVVAFLLLLVEHFLAPGPPVGRRGKVSEEVFHAVANPSEAHLYDWAGYVLEELRRCAVSVRRQVTSRCSKISLSGCLLFLQVFYLDRLDLETTDCEVPRDVLPPVAAYHYNSLYNAIYLDRQPEWPEGGLKLFGKLKFAVKQAAQTDDFGSTSTSKSPQPHLHSCDSEQHDSTKNTDMLSTVHGIDQYIKCHGIEHYVKFHGIEHLNRISKMNSSGLHNKLNKGEKYQPLAHDQHLPDAAKGTDTVNVHSYSGNTAPWVQAELKPKELLNNLQAAVTQQGVPSKKRSRSKFCGMIKEVSPSTEKEPTVQVTSWQTNPDSPEDVIILDRNPFVSSTLGSCPANPTPRSGHVEAFANLKPRTTQEVPLERTSPLEQADRNGARCESHPDTILGASPSSEAEKKPEVQATLCQTNSDWAEDVVILDKPFQSRTVGSTANSASRAQSRSNPKEICNNRRPKTQQEVASEKRSQSEFLKIKEKKRVVQMSSFQTTSDSCEDVKILDTNPFESRTVSFHPKTAAPRAQSRSKPKDVFPNLHPRTEQEVPSEKISQMESAVIKGTQCDTCQNKFPAASSVPEDRSVTQETPCQTTLEDVMILDSNPFESDAACTPSFSGPEMKKEYIFGRSPFEMGLVHPTPPSKHAEACFKWLEACSYQDDQLNWTWVILEEPNSVAVNGLHIKLQMIRGAVLNQDVCNLVMRLYRQLDDEIYHNSGSTEQRWRHFLPAEWSSSALELGDKICEPSPTVRSMFTGAHIAYDVGLCRMVIVPVELDGSWSCYVWDFMEKRLNILDPLLGRSGRNKETIKMKHSSSAPQLLSALLVCVSLYGNSHGYEHQGSSPNSWKTEFLQDFEGMRSRCEPNTGMYTLFYAREFDGKGLRQTVSERTIVSLRRDLLHQMLTMRGNTGRPPLVVDYPATGPFNVSYYFLRSK